MKPILAACVFVSLLLTASLAQAQGVGSSGDIKGTVTDASGGVLPKVTVAAVEAEKGFRRTALTDDSGEYRVTGLLPGTYDVTAELSGFQTEVRKGVTVSIGETFSVDFQLKVSQVATQVEVTTELPVVDTERGHQADTINEQYITDLPINRRDYLTYTLLVPGVTNSTRLAGDQDFRVKQTPQSGLSFYGSNGRGNSVTVDGGEANDDSGGVRLTLSQDAVQEFQINRSNYSADLGGAGGASINIVSKSGTNDVHVSLYGLFRNDALDAIDPFAFSQALQPKQIFDPTLPDSLGHPIKNSLNRQQFGGTLGFPIKKGKTFLFAAFEGLHQNAQNAVPILTNTNIFRPESDQAAILNALQTSTLPSVPCFTGTSLPPATCAFLLNDVLTVTQNAIPVPGLVTPGTIARNTFIINQLESNGGLFPYNTRDYLASGRLDHQFSDRNQLYFRYSFGHDREENPDVQSLTGFSRGSSVHAYDDTLQGAWFHQFSPRTSNEARAQWNYSNFSVIPNEPGQVGLDIPGFANLGTQIFLPSLTIMRRYELADNLTMIRGHHSMKFGGSFLYRGNHTESHTFFPGRFVFGLLPGGLLSPCFVASTSGPNPCGLTTFGANINSIQSVSLGLPHFYQQGFGNPIYNYPRPSTAAYWQDSWTIWPSFTLNYGIRYEVDSQYGPLATDKDNFAPRVSFAWDPFKDHKTVVRGGYGIFYTPIYGQIADVVQTLGNVNGNRQIAIFLDPIGGDPFTPTVPGAEVLFQTLFAQQLIQCTTPLPGNSACITNADLAQFNLNITNNGPLPPAPGAVPLPVIFTGQKDYQSPYSQQGEFGIEREISPGLSVSASYIYVHTLRLPVAIDTNLLPAPFTTVLLANGHAASFRDWTKGGCAGGGFGTCFVNPGFVQTNQYSSAGSAVYQGGILEIKKRFSNHFTLFGNYTYSKAIDDSTDFNSDFGPQDNTNLAGERALSTFDQRHKVVAAGVFDSPWKNWILSGFQLAPIFTYNSSHPFNLLANDVDVNNDRHYTNDRPIGAARNTGIGPNLFDFDMRISRQFKLGEKAGLQFIAEGFNIANRTNYASVNNEVGPLFGVCAIPSASGCAQPFTPGFTSFNVHGSKLLSPSQPLGFTSAFQKRQIQLGLRFTF
jgi:hypothetical protein